MKRLIEYSKKYKNNPSRFAGYVGWSLMWKYPNGIPSKKKSTNMVKEIKNDNVESKNDNIEPYGVLLGVIFGLLILVIPAMQINTSWHISLIEIVLLVSCVIFPIFCFVWKHIGKGNILERFVFTVIFFLILIMVIGYIVGIYYLVKTYNFDGIVTFCIIIATGFVPYLIYQAIKEN